MSKKCTGRRVYLLIVNEEPNAIFYKLKELNKLVDVMQYNNIRILYTSIGIDGVEIAKNRRN